MSKTKAPKPAGKAKAPTKAAGQKLAANPGAQRVPVKRALLVGINAYPAPNTLSGCVNDVSDMATLLVSSYGFVEDQVRLLVDARATTDAIRERLLWLTQGARPGDTLLFQYSGHGVLFPLRDASGSVAENHGAICPVDFDWSRERVLLDTDLRALLDTVPAGVEFIYVCDSCHSGDLVRAFERWQPRSYVVPADIAWRIRTAEAKGLAPSLLTQHDACALISGCTAQQTSADAVFAGRPNGALTYFLIQALKAADAHQQALPDLVAAVTKALLDQQYEQTPQLRGPDAILSRPFLG